MVNLSLDYVKLIQMSNKTLEDLKRNLASNQTLEEEHLNDLRTLANAAREFEGKLEATDDEFNKLNDQINFESKRETPNEVQSSDVLDLGTIQDTLSNSFAAYEVLMSHSLENKPLMGSPEISRQTPASSTVTQSPSSAPSQSSSWLLSSLLVRLLLSYPLTRSSNLPVQILFSHLLVRVPSLHRGPRLDLRIGRGTD